MLVGGEAVRCLKALLSWVSQQADISIKSKTSLVYQCARLVVNISTRLRFTHLQLIMRTRWSIHQCILRAGLRIASSQHVRIRRRVTRMNLTLGCKSARKPSNLVVIFFPFGNLTCPRQFGLLLSSDESDEWRDKVGISGDEP